MKKLILLSLVVVIGYLTIIADFTAPVIKYSNADENKSLTTDNSFRIIVDVDGERLSTNVKATVTCHWEQISGPRPLGTGFSEFLSIVMKKRAFCVLGPYETDHQPGEMRFLLTVTDKNDRSSTMTIPIIVAQGASPKVCKNGKRATRDSNGSRCCSEDLMQIFPKGNMDTITFINKIQFYCRASKIIPYEKPLPK